MVVFWTHTGNRGESRSHAQNQNKRLLAQTLATHYMWTLRNNWIIIPFIVC